MRQETGVVVRCHLRRVRFRECLINFARPRCCCCRSRRLWRGRLWSSSNKPRLSILFFQHVSAVWALRRRLVSHDDVTLRNGNALTYSQWSAGRILALNFLTLGLGQGRWGEKRDYKEETDDYESHNRYPLAECRKLAAIIVAERFGCQPPSFVRVLPGPVIVKVLTVPDARYR